MGKFAAWWGKSVNPILFSSASAEWATPQWLFDALNERFHFTLDPCCTAATAKCRKFYTRADNGLAHSWAGERVFLNPPYGKKEKGQPDSGIEPWVQKAREEAAAGALVVGLLPARVDTEWLQDNVHGHADIHFFRGRIRFIPPPGYVPPPGVKKPSGAGFPSAIAVWWGWDSLNGGFA
jgi:site-specific DNA-methyltransferase (adenine-specific)